jgi:hypothetical protein
MGRPKGSHVPPLIVASSGDARDAATLCCMTDATVELAKLREKQARLAARVSQVEGEQRAATAAVEAARNELVRLERSSALGEKVSQTARQRAEDALLQARTAGAAPWGERIAGAQEAARQAEQEVRAFIGRRLSELVEALEADGRTAAADLTAHAEGVIAAYERRETIAREISALASMVAPVRPGDVTRTASEQLAAACNALILGGGENPPRLAHDPRQPRYGQVPEQAHAVPAGASAS